MLKTRIRSSPLLLTDHEKVPDIVAHYDYVDKLLEWSLNDLDHLILILEQRITAEKAYVKALSEIKQLPPPPTIDVLPFDGQPTFTAAKTKFKDNLVRTISERAHLVETMTSQLEVLLILKSEQEKKKRRIKTSLARRNTDYLMHRSKMLPEQRNDYMTKYAALEQEENMMMAAAAAAAAGNDDTMSISSSESAALEKRKNHRGSLQTFRQHLTPKTPAAEHNNKIAKLKHDVMEADRNYRNSVVTLERLREEQMKMVKIVHENIKVMFMDKTEITKSVLRYIFVTERSIQSRESSMLQVLTKTCDEMDGREDMASFAQRMENLNFPSPEPIYYEHYKHGLLKDAQFGISLQMYSKTHGDRNVPVLVSRCIKAVEGMGGLYREGIYRISGRYAHVDALRLEFEKDEELCDLKQYDLSTVASVLKVYLRELEGPLWTFPMTLRDDYSRKDDAARLHELEIRIAELTPPHRETLQVIIEHLARIAAQADKNKMTIHNISVIFTPAIFHDEQQSQSGPDRVLADLITHHEALFAKYSSPTGNDAEVQQTASDSPTADDAPPVVAAAVAAATATATATAAAAAEPEGVPNGPLPTPGPSTDMSTAKDIEPVAAVVADCQPNS